MLENRLYNVSSLRCQIMELEKVDQLEKFMSLALAVVVTQQYAGVHTKIRLGIFLALFIAIFFVVTFIITATKQFFVSWFFVFGHGNLI